MPIEFKVLNGTQNCPPYRIKIDSKWTVQRQMFTRADMAYWGFSAADVEPPTGMRLEYRDGNMEPVFEVDTQKCPYCGRKWDGIHGS